MAKLKKYQRVTNYLSEKWESGELSAEKLAKLHYKELIDVPDFKDIGGRTISNILKDFKKSRGVLPVTLNISKKKMVRDYLDSLMNSGELTPDTVSDLSYHDLVNQKELEGIGKTTISSVLSEYKKRYENSVVDEGILSFIGKQSESVENARPGKRAHATHTQFNQQEIDILKQMIAAYNQQPEAKSSATNIELKELKSALDFVGINSQTLLKRYWKLKQSMVIPVTRMMKSSQKQEDFTFESA